MKVFQPCLRKETQELIANHAVKHLFTNNTKPDYGCPHLVSKLSPPRRAVTLLNADETMDIRQSLA